MSPGMSREEEAVAEAAYQARRADKAASQPSSTTRTEPRTEAGRKLLDGHYPSGVPFKEQMREFLRRSILDIEREQGDLSAEWYTKIVPPEAAPPPPAPLDGFTSDELVAELRRRNLRLHTTDELLAGLSEPEILDFVDAGAVTAEQARAYLAHLTLESSE